MKLKMYQMSLALVLLMGALFVACTNGVDDQASSTLETENSVALNVKLADGTVAARYRVIVRPEDYLAGSKSLDVSSDETDLFDSAAGYFNSETDDQGQVNVPKMKSGNYVVEVRNENIKGVSRFTVTPDECDILTVDLAKSGSLSGQVLMPPGVSSVKVGIRGLDYVVETDSLGNFEFKSLPAGSFDAVGFIFSISDYINDEGEEDTFESFQVLGVASIELKPADSVNVVIGTRYKDTTSVDTLPYIMLSDFEDSTYGWFSSYSRYANVSFGVVNDGPEHGLVAHLECRSDSLYTWTMIGQNFTKFHDFSSLDSVVLWVRGENPDDDFMWVSVSFDVHVDNSTADSLLGYEYGKSWTHKEITNKWSRIVVTPDDLLPLDSNRTGGNLGWENVKDHVNSIGLFGGRANTGEYELWIDDVEIYGVKGL